MKKILKAGAILLLLLFASLYTYVYFNCVKLPAPALTAIEQAMEEDLPNLVQGTHGYAQNGDTRIWYEAIPPSDSIKGDILLMMGIGSNSIAWPDHFIRPLVDRGYRVIRYDNRGTGLTDWKDEWDDQPYTMSDLVHDGLAILDELNIDSVHVIGGSMGGMIAQQMAIDHPGRVRTLTSLFSSGYVEDPHLPGVFGGGSLIKDFILHAIKYGLIRTERNTIKLHMSMRHLLMGSTSYEPDYKAIAREVLYSLRHHGGYNDKATQQQGTAISNAGSRYNSLQGVRIPTLIIHGTTDPAMPFAHGKKCASLIPQADSLWVEGMGHDIPEQFAGPMLEKILSHLDTSTSRKF